MAMADDLPPNYRPPYKTRSASISAPASSSLETIINPGSNTPETGNGTPGYQRRRPARTQSARITGNRSVSVNNCIICAFNTLLINPFVVTSPNTALYSPYRESWPASPSFSSFSSTNYDSKWKSKEIFQTFFRSMSEIIIIWNKFSLFLFIWNEPLILLVLLGCCRMKCEQMEAKLKTANMFPLVRTALYTNMYINITVYHRIKIIIYFQFPLKSD